MGFITTFLELFPNIKHANPSLCGLLSCTREHFHFVDDMNAWEVNCYGVYAEKTLGWWFQTYLMFTPNLGKIPILTNIFSDGLVQPPTQLLIENSQRETNRTLDVKMNIAPLKQVLYERGLADKKQREQKARSGKGGRKSK